MMKELTPSGFRLLPQGQELKRAVLRQALALIVRVDALADTVRIGPVGKIAAIKAKACGVIRSVTTDRIGIARKQDLLNASVG